MTNKHASGTTKPTVPRPSHAECAKTLLDVHHQATLCTHSAHQDGYPFGSMMPYALDKQGDPIFLISSMAMHTQNILQNKHASLYVAQTVAEGEPLGASRLTLLGDIEEAVDEDARSCYLAAHPNAKHWVDFSDFSFYRMTLHSLYFVGGFGVMGWVTQADYAQAQADPLRHVATHAIQHMNESHADALVLLAKAQAGMDADAVQMVGLDRLGFDMKVHMGDNIRAARIAFSDPLDDPKKVRSVFVSMVQAAREKLA